MDTDPKLEVEGDGEYTLPCAEALLAGTLALMTGHAQNSCPNRRMLMALKIRHNLDQLRSHDALSEQFRQVLLRLCHEWGALVVGMPARACPADQAGQAQALERHWLPTPGLMQ
jgi:hypothetical protein